MLKPSKCLKLLCFVLYLLTIARQTICQTKVETKLYDYKKEKAFTKQYVTLTLPIKFPHWSDPENKIINIVNSGIARFSGLDAANTLDVLLWATAVPLPKANSILLEHRKADDVIKEQIKKDLEKIQVQNFLSQYVVIATWNEAEFSYDKYSTFQMVFTSNGNKTYAILHILKLGYHTKDNIIFPEVDTRYSYDSGSKYFRSRFLWNETKVNTVTPQVGKAATENSNVGVPGTWIINLTDDPRPKKPPNPTGNTTTPKPTSLPVPESKYTKSVGVSMRGSFTFTKLLLGGELLTDNKNNDEISVLLSKKDSDETYVQLIKEIKSWLRNVYKNVSGGQDAVIKIIGLKVGSLVVDYIATVPKIGNCSRTCVDLVEKAIKNISSVHSGALNGQLDSKRTEISGSQLCNVTPGTNCDVNAHCLEQSGDSGSYRCACKDGYEGEGFPGKCFKPNKGKIILTSASVMAVLASLSIGGMIYYTIRKEKQSFEEKEKSMSRVSPIKTLNNSRSRKRFGRKGTHLDGDFEVYHRT